MRGVEPTAGGQVITTGGPVIRVFYEQRPRPEPATEVPGIDGTLLMVAGQAAMALVGGFASALLTTCSHRACTSHREKFMTKVQPTQTVLVLETVGVYERRRRPGPAQRVPAGHGAAVIGGNHAAIALVDGHASAPRDQAIGMSYSGSTASPCCISGVYNVTPDAAIPRLLTRPGLGTKWDRRRTAAPMIHAQRMAAEVITAQRMPAGCQRGEQTNPRQLRTARPTVMVCATHASGQPAFGRPRQNVGRQCRYLTLTPTGAFDSRAAVHGFSLRYPRGN
jgi:hypothetical protein